LDHTTKSDSSEALSAIIRTIFYSVALFEWSWITMLPSSQSKLGRKPKIDDKDRLKLAFSDAVGGLQVAIQITKSVASGVGLGPPGLQAGLSGLSIVLDAIQVNFQLYSFTIV
jgi:hypothetical protein